MSEPCLRGLTDGLPLVSAPKFDDFDQDCTPLLFVLLLGGHEMKIRPTEIGEFPQFARWVDAAPTDQAVGDLPDTPLGVVIVPMYTPKRR
ncbi:hypothetical protein IU510_06250 [Nocardia cyriacigeorgica]|uniref:hypothetical protein n=1 Tax=Nocardia cyriacigeorgica TaxID=135487 RepID=UPI0018936856|nr:hypothetical protein [Nocardia cyriacigeorgica]MBF6097681.1 hypothetical protein [Nocardia cyriacigeorgica]MBF6161676.1 hypothetical protein [Nocardia cyriacigeorgica]MBF6200474.1 hypothetical protein [Nocardia cyriacigeorgica]MBF6342062.1 hypothetical protein [Nocardia cyriacigeorgica]MBF6512974.1 hypothetical protein [Nocardia cyriacigeorgica]